MPFKNPFEKLLADEVVQETMEQYGVRNSEMYKPPKKDLRVFWGKEQIDSDVMMGQNAQCFGITQSGKTTTGARIAEELIVIGVKLCIIDNDKGDFRSFEKFSTVKIIELENPPNNPEKLAQDFVGDDSSVVFTRAKGVDREVYMPFIETFFDAMLQAAIKRKDAVDADKKRAKATNTRQEIFMKAIKIFIDEAQDFLPSNLSDIYDTELKTCVKKFRKTIEKIARQALSYGISLFIMCQRPTDMITSIRSQTEIWLLHRQTGDTDLDYYTRIAPAGRGHEKNEFIKFCKNMGRGECLLVLFGSALKSYQVRNRRTAHGSGAVRYADIAGWEA